MKNTYFVIYDLTEEPTSPYFAYYWHIGTNNNLLYEVNTVLQRQKARNKQTTFADLRLFVFDTKANFDKSFDDNCRKIDWQLL